MTDFSRKDGRIAQSRGYRDFVSAVITVPGTPAVTEIPGDPIIFDQAYLEGLNAGEQTVLETFVSTDASFAEIRKDINYRKVPPVCITERTDFGVDPWSIQLDSAARYQNTGSSIRRSYGIRYLKDGADFLLCSMDTNAGGTFTMINTPLLQVPWYLPAGVDPLKVPLPRFSLELFNDDVAQRAFRIADRNVPAYKGGHMNCAINPSNTDSWPRVPIILDTDNFTTFVEGWNYLPFTMEFPVGITPRIPGLSWVIRDLHTSLPLGTSLEVKAVADIVGVETVKSSDNSTLTDVGTSTFADSITGVAGALSYTTSHTHAVWHDAGAAVVGADDRYFRIPQSAWIENDTATPAPHAGLEMICLDPYNDIRSGSSITGPIDPDWGSGASFTQVACALAKPGTVQFSTVRFNRSAAYAWFNSIRGIVVLNKL